MVYEGDEENVSSFYERPKSCKLSKTRHSREKTLGRIHIFVTQATKASKRVRV